MKKNLIKPILIFLLVSLLVPLAISAQDKPLDQCELNRDVSINGDDFLEGETVGRIGSGADKETKKWSLICLISSIKVIGDWVFAIVMALVATMIAIGTYYIMTAAGDPNKVSQGKNFIMYAMIGMVVGLLSKGIPDLVETLIGI